MATLEKIGKYEILAKIGEGGFGIVYKGKDPFIKRLVAVKTCSSENEAIQKRFFREAEIAGNLHHANVVTIHDFGVEGETPYLVQEFLTGEDLDVLISNPDHHLSLPIKVRYLRGIAEGLRYAHAQGVIHRDIKPANIRILENNRVKVMDFGIAKLKDQESQLTQTGMALGTVAYMSPEQLKGESVDHRVDIFSFGVLAYELIVGRRPFQAESVSTLFYQLLHENAPAITDPEVPRQLVEIVERCLAKTLDVRYGSFDEVLADLDAVQKIVGEDQEAITADPFSTDPASTLTRLAAKAARAIDAGDLTAAQVTLDLARKECDPTTFDREFGELVRAIGEKRATRTTGSSEAPALDLPSQIERIDSQLRAGKIDTAAVAFTALEMQYPDDPRVQQLRTRVSQAIHLPPTAGPPPLGTAPVTAAPAATAPVAAPAGSAARQRARTGPLIAAAAAVTLLAVVGTVLALRFLGGRGEAENGQTVPEISTPTGTETEPAAPISPTTDPAAGGDGDSEPTATPVESEPETSPTATPSASTPTSPTPTPNDSRPSTTPSTTPESTPGNGGSATRPRANDRPSTTGARDTTSTRPSDRGSANNPSSSRPNPPQPREVTPTVDPPPRDRPAESPSTPTEPVDTTPTEREAPAEPEPDASFDLERFRIQSDIRGVLDAYRDAWISRDEEVINRYYPGENATRRDVRGFRTVEASVECNSFDLRDNSATANCTITLVKRPRNGDPVTVTYTRAELVKQGTRWVIQSLR